MAGCKAITRRIHFSAMASDCELLFIGASDAQANTFAELAIAEVRRIEAKFSRYRPESELSRINGLAGSHIPIDPETGVLLKFAADCFRLSGGLFDVTIAPLQQLWRFGFKHHGLNHECFPQEAQIKAALDHIGFERLGIESNSLWLPAGMSLDFGGIAKEYAADRALLLIERQARDRGLDVAVLVNLGGDIAASQYPWQIGVEGVHAECDSDLLNAEASGLIAFPGGGLATSGDTKRFVLVDGKRVGHILSPKTGYPVPDSPRSVTVLAPSASAAGMLSTMAMLKGEGAEDFLRGEGLVYLVQR